MMMFMFFIIVMMISLFRMIGFAMIMTSAATAMAAMTKQVYADKYGKNQHPEPVR